MGLITSKIRIDKYGVLSDSVLNARGQSISALGFDDSYIISTLGNESYIKYDYDEEYWYLDMSLLLGEIKITDLSDILITNLEEGDVIVYDPDEQKWINSDLLITAVTDISNIKLDIEDINTQITTTNNSVSNLETNTNNQISVIDERLVNLETAESPASVPVGGIIMWSGYEVPVNWSLCDGTNGTPNLIDRFIVGGDLTTNNSSGGETSPTVVDSISFVLAKNQIPPHTHAYEDNYGQGASNFKYAGSDVFAHNSNYQAIRQSGSSDLGENYNGTGNAAPVNIDLPQKKYYVLAFIMYTGVSTSTEVYNPE